MARRRGRPREHRPEHDPGTPELAAKRAAGQTMETLDLCLARGILTPQQHWCGIHLRWLYTLRYGAPGVRALDTAHAGGMDIRPDDPAWREAREMEYQAALKYLRPAQAASVLSLCIFNERPFWLAARESISAAHACRVEAAVALIQEGFAALERLWCRKGKIKKVDQ